MKYFITPMLMLFFSCNKDIHNLTIKGTVQSAENKEPISDVEVTVICWKYADSPDDSYSESETKVVKTDNEGKYKANFNKGAFVEVKVSLINYTMEHESREIYNKKTTINVLLKKE
jgi:hypothetical protein